MRLVAFIILVAGHSQAALAQNDPSAGQVQFSPNTSQSQDRDPSQARNQSISQEIREELAKLGFNDVKLMPDSVIVTAKKEGRNVVLWLQPHILTELTMDMPNDEDEITGGTNNPGPSNPTLPKQERR